MKKILLLQTGGTIAMNLEAVHTEVEAWSDVLSHQIPELSAIADIQVLPLFLEDSSNVNHHHWSKLIEAIGRHYEQFDGFVILHGTDTMAYTASALSFCLQGLDKPVILTGSQLPIAQLRSDARRNLVNAIEMATLDIPEVCICFNDHLFRGNRTTKMSIGDFDAFASPNFPPLAEIGIQINLNAVTCPRRKKRFYHSCFSDDLFVLKIYPNLKYRFLDCIDLSSTRLIIIEAFGSGNAPVTGPYSLLPFLEKCRKAGVIILIASQAPYDSVDLTKYTAGKQVAKQGGISARDMTIEACITKSMFLLHQYKNNSDVAGQLTQNIAGEISTE